MRSQYWMHDLETNLIGQIWELPYEEQRTKAIEKAIKIAIATNQSWRVYNGNTAISTIYVGGARTSKKLYPIEETEICGVHSDADKQKALVLCDPESPEWRYLFNQLRHKEMESKKIA